MKRENPKPIPCTKNIPQKNPLPKPTEEAEINFCRYPTPKNIPHQLPNLHIPEKLCASTPTRNYSH
jgi:hypothetical protein